MRFALRILVILAASVAAGAASRAFRFASVPWILPPDDARGNAELLKSLDISLEDVKKLIAQADAGSTVLLIDAREEKEFAEGHIACANIINVPADHAHEHLDRVTAFDGWTIVLYCTSRTCDAAQRVYNLLNSSGFTNLKIYEDGWEAWSQAKLPVAKGAGSVMGDPAAAAHGEPTDGAGGADDEASGDQPPTDETATTKPGGGE